MAATPRAPEALTLSPRPLCAVRSSTVGLSVGARAVGAGKDESDHSDGPTTSVGERSMSIRDAESKDARNRQFDRAQEALAGIVDSTPVRSRHYRTLRALQKLAVSVLDMHRP